MTIKLYNTLTRKKETFKPIKKGRVGMYNCGPTVYWHQHIGNLRTYVFADILKRILVYNGFKVNQIMNVTDVGHLTSDADTGEDKMENAVKREGKKASEIANYYLKLFKDDFKKLNISEPDKWTKATKYIKEQIDLIKILEKKGYTYKIDDGIYFDTSKLKDYGKLARLNIKNLKAGKRIDIGGKNIKTDFALWKFSEEPGKRQQEWDSPWGVGFPGWHIECSAMSSKHLGKHFDIHTGGMDHIPVHHTNEIAQSEAAFGKTPWVNYWLHGAWLLHKGEKISKSKGGLYTVSELEKQGFAPLSFRYLLLTTHYKKPLNFSLENLKKAQESLRRLKNIIGEMQNSTKVSDTYLKEFERAINDNLDMPKALQVLWKLARDKSPVGIKLKNLDNKKSRFHSKVKSKSKVEIIKKMDDVFGLDLLKKEKVSIPKNIKELVKKREAAREDKKWKEADGLRDKIKKLGYLIDDTQQGTKVRKE